MACILLYVVIVIFFSVVFHCLLLYVCLLFIVTCVLDNKGNLLTYLLENFTK